MCLIQIMNVKYQISVYDYVSYILKINKYNFFNLSLLFFYV